MTEKEKMISGKIYDPSDKELTQLRQNAHRLCTEYNVLPETDEKRGEVLKSLGINGSAFYLQGPVQFDYGCFTTIGVNSYANFNFTCVDCCPVTIGDNEYCITCVATGNPHCVVFVDNVDKLDLQQIGPQFENSPLFPERVNTEFVRVVNESTIKMRVWERGNGETPACGTGACAAVIAAVENGYCKKGVDVTVKVRGGDLLVNYTDDRITLTGDCNTVYKGEIEY